MSPFPCINPTCSHLFAAQDLASAAALRCPKCGQEIQLRAGASAAPAPPAVAAPLKAAPPQARTAPPPKPPVARPVLAKPVAPPAPPQPKPVASAPPPPRPVSSAAFAASAPSAAYAATPVLSGAAEAAFENLDASGAVFTRQPRRAPGSTRSWLSLVAIAFILLGSVLIVFLLIRRSRSGNESNSLYDGTTQDQPYSIVNLEGKSELAFMIRLPDDKGWKADETAKKKFKVLAGWWDEESQVRLLVLAKDYGSYRPRDAEMIRIGIETLYGVYDERLEATAMPKPSSVAETEAQKLEFKARDPERPVFHRGEMHFFSKNGIGYWLFVIGPEDAETKPCETTFKWLEDRKLGLRLTDDRKGWREQPPRMVTFSSDSGLLALTLPHGIYEKAERLKDLEAPELTLLGRYSKEKDPRKNAHVQVFIFERQIDLDAAMKKAKEHMLGLATPPEAAGYKLEVSPDAEAGTGELGKKGMVGDHPAQIGDYCLKIFDKPERCFVVAVMNDEKQMILISCDVVWDNRQIWYEDFHDLLKKAKVRKGG